MGKCSCCGKELPGVSCDIQGQDTWVCRECMMSDDVKFCVRGDNVVYAHPNAGSHSAQLMASKHLTTGNIYVVDAVTVHHYGVYVKFQGLPPIWFDTRLFDRVNNG